MKKNVLYIILVLVLIAIAVVFYFHDEKSTLLSGSDEFTLDEPEKVDSLLLKQDSVRFTLVKKNENWTLNGIVPVRKKAVNHLFDVLTELKIEAPVTKENQEEVIDLVKQNPIHVKIYSKGKKIKDYLVEDSEYKKGVTYMMMNDKSTPFLMSIPGFDGDIADLYYVDPSFWRDRTIFNYSAVDIRSVIVQYSASSKNSFELKYKEDGFSLKDLNEDKELEAVSNNKASRYYSYFSDIRYERIFKRQRLLDSIKQGQPFCEITVRDKSDNTLTLKTYRKPSSGESDAFGQQGKYDLNHLYGIYSEFDEILLIKYTEIDPLFKEIDYFRVD
ncbi:MAG: DUF4340 domain-containing protein [Bacteroidota bacterium]